MLKADRWDLRIGPRKSASGKNYGVKSYTDKRWGWNCLNQNSRKWRVIYEYGYREQGCTCNSKQYFVVKSDYRSLSCGGLSR